jgi:hypothetical protein
VFCRGHSCVEVMAPTGVSNVRLVDSWVHGKDNNHVKSYSAIVGEILTSDNVEMSTMEGGANGVRSRARGGR